ncbi:MAG: hypothetical protein Tp1111DCM1126091_103 [Prokaryotic dsDNA virus sp.]|nr:MAG: hypothetical protein Tp1111DCM1126091_103 [Prokaryotic dsDNA virus sp.]|tara:strand:- start:48368 stop:48607 length:240 start_codon:yes stop_codon:yes gene_type:complete
MKKLYEAIDRDTSLEQMELLVFRPVFAEHSSVTLTDLLNSTLEFTLKVNEFLDIKESIEEEHSKEMEAAQKKNMPRGGR